MINRRLKLSNRARTASEPQPAAESGREMALVFDEQGRALLVPEDPKDVFNDPFASFTEWDGEADHKAYDKLRQG